MTELVPRHDGCTEEVRMETQLMFSWTMRAFVKHSFYNISRPIPGSPFARSPGQEQTSRESRCVRAAQSAQGLRARHVGDACGRTTGGQLGELSCVWYSAGMSFTSMDTFWLLLLTAARAPVAG